MLLKAEAGVGTEKAKAHEGDRQVGHELVGFVFNKISFRGQQIVRQFVGKGRYQPGGVVQELWCIGDNDIAARFDSKCTVWCLIATQVNEFGNLLTRPSASLRLETAGPVRKSHDTLHTLKDMFGLRMTGSFCRREILPGREHKRRISDRDSVAIAFNQHCPHVEVPRLNVRIQKAASAEQGRKH